MDNFDDLVRAQKARETELLLSKHRDYGPGNIAGAPGGPVNGLRVRLYDKLARLNNLVDSGADPQHESLIDTALDIACYGTILGLVLRGEWPTLNPYDQHPTRLLVDPIEEEPEPKPGWIARSLGDEAWNYPTTLNADVQAAIEAARREIEDNPPAPPEEPWSPSVGDVVEAIGVVGVVSGTEGTHTLLIEPAVSLRTGLPYDDSLRFFNETPRPYEGPDELIVDRTYRVVPWAEGYEYWSRYAGELVTLDTEWVDGDGHLMVKTQDGNNHLEWFDPTHLVGPLPE